MTMILALGLAFVLSAADAFAPAASAVGAMRANTRKGLSMGLAVGDTFPPAALASWGVKGKTAVIYFYGADGSPSCTKEAEAFDAASLGAPVIGVRNDGGVKEGWDETYPGVKFVVDEGDEVRNEIGIAKDLFFLGGRETYVVDAKGTIASVFNSQFAPEKHVEVAEAALEELKPVKAQGFSFPNP